MRDHPITVAAPRSLGQAGAPYLLERDDPDFVEAVLAELPTAAGRTRLAETRARARNAEHLLKLYPPVQRRFHLALIEAWCETAGRPRLDPLRVDAAGFVLRRIRERNGGGRTLEGWMRAGGVVRGWVPIDRLGAPDDDSLAAVRLARRATGVASIDRALRALRAGEDSSVLEEDVTPMFVAPPDVCEAAGRTLFYGVVTAASSELAQSEPDVASIFDGFGPESEDFRGHLEPALRGRGYDFPAPPLQPAGRRFDSTWPVTSSADDDLKDFLRLLRQIVVEFDIFGDSPASRALRAELEGIRLEYALGTGEPPPRTVGAVDFLSDATRVLFDGDSGSIELPKRWPALSKAQSASLARTLWAAMRERFKSVKGRPGRFDEPDAPYVLRAFVRLEAEGDCPPRTVWSDYTEPFVIAPWYESAADPVQVALPDLSDRDLLKSLKPNVAFTLPPALQDLLSRSPEDLMEGNGGEPEDTGIGWICSFSIPVITFCAFIVLNIFLSLFDLFFRWLVYIKVCIPYPKAK